MLKSVTNLVEKGVYRHYKGGIYTVLGVVKPKDASMVETLQRATHTELEVEATIYVDRNRDYAGYSTLDGEEGRLVLYTDKDDKMWLRSADMFAGTLQHKGSEVKRFKVKDI